MNNEASTDNAAGAQATGRTAIHVLMVEDEKAFIETLVPFIELNGYKVDAAENGVDALKLVMAKDYDLILCDMQMPKLSGDMFYLAVERVKPQQCKRFIFMTGHKGDPKTDDFIRKINGMLLWKPFEAEELLNTMQLVLQTNTPS